MEYTIFDIFDRWIPCLKALNSLKEGPDGKERLKDELNTVAIQRGNFKNAKEQNWLLCDDVQTLSGGPSL